MKQLIQNKVNSNKYINSSQGMSLLELLIYIAILSGLMVTVSSAFISLSKGRGQSEARSEVASAVRFATEKIRQDIKSADTIASPVLGVASSTLALTASGVGVVYDVSQGQLRRKEGVATPAIVTGPGVFIENLLFTRFESYNSILSATTTAIQVLITAKYNSSSTDWAYSDSIRTTISTR